MSLTAAINTVNKKIIKKFGGNTIFKAVSTSDKAVAVGSDKAVSIVAGWRSSNSAH